MAPTTPGGGREAGLLHKALRSALGLVVVAPPVALGAGVASAQRLALGVLYLP